MDVGGEDFLAVGCGRRLKKLLMLLMKLSLLNLRLCQGRGRCIESRRLGGGGHDLVERNASSCGRDSKKRWD